MSSNRTLVEQIMREHNAAAQAIGEREPFSPEQLLENSVIILPAERRLGRVEVKFLKDEETARAIRESINRLAVSRHITSYAITTPSQLVPEWGWTLTVAIVDRISDFETALQIRDAVRSLLRPADFRS